MSYKPSFYLYKVRTYRKIKLVFLKGGKCSACGYKKCINALEFHHRDPRTKLFKLSGINLTKYSWEKILIEVEKCDLLCSNCHKEQNFGPRPSATAEKNSPTESALDQ